MRSTLPTGNVFRACLVLALCASLAFGFCACTAEYVNENGPRGPEHVRFGTAYPRPLAPCNPAPVEQPR